MHLGRSPRTPCSAALAALLLILSQSAHASQPLPPPPAAPPAGNARDTHARATSEKAKPPVVIWPTLTPAGDAPSAAPLHKPVAADTQLFERAAELDATLRDAVQDLGFTLFVADAGPSAGHTRDEDLIERAARPAAQPETPDQGGAGSGGKGDEDASGGTWVISPRIESAGGGQYVVRIVAAPPRGRELRVRVETVAADSVSVRGLVMLRDLLSPQAAAQAALEQERLQAARGSTLGILRPLRSQGRAVLAVGAGLFGAFTAFSLEAGASASSPDPRVLYPLLAVGTGIGIGSALLVADEWDVTTGDAWFLTAGGSWAAASGFLLAAGHGVQPITDRYSWAVGGGLVGLGLATAALTRQAMSDGDAALTHSGGAIGLLLGGATEFLDRGSMSATPYTGMGYGSALGLVAAGVLAQRLDWSPSRVLLVDVGVGGGALLGAAAASPLVVEHPTEAKTRGWVSATLAGSIAGALATGWLTHDGGSHAPWSAPLAAVARFAHGLPHVGILGATPTPAGSVPIYGVGWSGAL